MSILRRSLCLRVHSLLLVFLFFFFNDTATTEIYTFPYTTLFRSRQIVQALVDVADRFGRKVHGDHRAIAGSRSEEHTSELQSRRDLVCRLLLEKKKKKKKEIYLNYFDRDV